MNVLLSAYACEPDKGSEPEAGFQIALAASRVARHVTVLTRANNKEALRERFPPNVEVVGFDLGPIWLRLKKWLPGGTQAYYWAWQKALPPVVSSLHASRRYDLVHHATFAADWMPVGAAISGIPLVWGPVGGGVGVPWRMWRTIGVGGLPRELIRQMVGSLFRAIYGRRTAQRADLVIAQNLHEYRIWKGLTKKIRVRPNVVVSPPEAARSKVASVHARRAVFVGRLVPLKGAVWAIRALAEHSADGWSLEVIGDGPERDRLGAEVKRLGLAQRVTFRGWLPRDAVLEALQQVDAMIAPSMYEGAGFAAAEAVTLGCPVVATRRGGLEVVVGDGQGVLVEADRRLAEAIANALKGLGGRHGGTQAWSPDSLTSAVREWYREVGVH